MWLEPAFILQAKQRLAHPPWLGSTEACYYMPPGGHKTGPGIAKIGTSNTLLPNWFVFLHPNCINKPFSPIKTSDRYNWRFLSKAFWPVTTKFDFLEGVKKASNNSAHRVASSGSDRSNKPCTLHKICGARGAVCRVVWGFRRFSAFNVSFSSILSVPGKGTSSKAQNNQINTEQQEAFPLSY